MDSTENLVNATKGMLSALGVDLGEKWNNAQGTNTHDRKPTSGGFTSAMSWNMTLGKLIRLARAEDMVTLDAELLRLAMVNQEQIIEIIAAIHFLGYRINAVQKHKAAVEKLLAEEGTEGEPLPPRRERQDVNSDPRERFTDDTPLEPLTPFGDETWMQEY